MWLSRSEAVGVVAELLQPPAALGHPDHGHVEHAPLDQPHQRRERLDLGQVPGRAEDHQRVNFVRHVIPPDPVVSDQIAPGPGQHPPQRVIAVQLRRLGRRERQAGVSAPARARLRGWRWRLEFLLADAPPEHVVGPGLVGEHHRQEDDDDDGHHLERVRARRGVVHGEVVGRVGAGDHHVGVQVDEDRQDAGRDGDGGRGEGEALAVVVDEPDGGEDGEHGEQLDHVEEERGAGGHVGPDDEADDGGGGERGRRGGPACQDRSRMSPVVFRHRNVAPCSRQTSDQGDAGEQGVGLEQVPERAGVVLGRS